MIKKIKKLKETKAKPSSIRQGKKKSSKEDPNNKKVIKILSYSLVTVVLLTLIIVTSFSYRNQKVAEKILTKTMEFENINEIETNISEIEKYLTSDLKENYGLNNEDFTYFNFLKMRNSNTRIEVLSKYKNTKSGYIIYRIENEYIEKYRRFVMEYRTDFLGKFVEINYYEFAGKL